MLHQEASILKLIEETPPQSGGYKSYVLLDEYFEPFIDSGLIPFILSERIRKNGFISGSPI
jgi:hypothetical protein